MKIAVGSDERTNLTGSVIANLAERSHEPVFFGAVAASDGAPAGPADWPLISRQVAEAVAAGQCQEGIFFCWTGTGASIVANKVPGIRAALCHDAETARGARLWNHVNILVLSLRSTSEAVATEILERWFTTPWSGDEADLLQVTRIHELERYYGTCGEKASRSDPGSGVHRLESSRGGRSARPAGKRGNPGHSSI